MCSTKSPTTKHRRSINRNFAHTLGHTHIHERIHTHSLIPQVDKATNLCVPKKERKKDARSDKKSDSGKSGSSRAGGDKSERMEKKAKEQARMKKESEARVSGQEKEARKVADQIKSMEEVNVCSFVMLAFWRVRVTVSLCM